MNQSHFGYSWTTHFLFISKDESTIEVLAMLKYLRRFDKKVSEQKKNNSNEEWNAIEVLESKTRASACKCEFFEFKSKQSGE